MQMVVNLSASDAVHRAEGLSVSVLLTEGCNLLTFAAVADPVHAIGGQLRRLSCDGAPVMTSCGITLSVQGCADQVSTADLLVILGGEQRLTRRLRDHLRLACSLGQRICATGSAVMLLAEAGVLKGRRISVPEALRPDFSHRHPDLHPEPEAFTLDGRLATCPDGPVAIDVILHLLRDIVGAESLRPVLSRCMLHPPRKSAELPRPQNVGPQALQRMLRVMTEGLAEPDILAKAESASALSRRQIERLFSAHLKSSPARYLRDLRLDEGRRLLAQTVLTVDDIATKVGFIDTAHFSRRYRQRHGCSPHATNFPV